jgi:GDP-L-fucose synthase
MLTKDSKIYVAGHHGLVGSAIWNNLLQRGYTNLVGRSHQELDLTDQLAVRRFFDEERPVAVVLAAAFVGGIMANSLYRADFIMMNMKIQCNVISEAYAHGVEKLLFLGSTCIYPKNAPQPMKEDCLLTSPLEYTNEEYAIAKIAGLKMCESYNLQYGTNYIAVMPTNLYGPNDNFHLENSHVMPAMMRKIYLAKLIHDGAWEKIGNDLNQRPVTIRNAAEGAVTDSSSHDDILAALASMKDSGQVVVGFAAETNDLIAYAQAKLAKKGCDLIVANDVSRADSTFGADTSRISLVSSEGVDERETMPLPQVADAILDRVCEIMEGRA